MATIARGGIEALLGLMDEAFDGGGIEASNESQALLTNLATVADDQWRARPRGVDPDHRVDRPPRRRVQGHVRRLRVRAGTLQFGTPEVEPWTAEGPAPMEDVRAWLRAAQARLRSTWRTCRMTHNSTFARLTNWGEHRPTRWIVAAMITHDAYHAGEINHLRSQLSGDDRWRYVQLGFG